MLGLSWSSVGQRGGFRCPSPQTDLQFGDIFTRILIGGFGGREHPSRPSQGVSVEGPWGRGQLSHAAVSCHMHDWGTGRCSYVEAATFLAWMREAAGAERAFSTLTSFVAIKVLGKHASAESHFPCTAWPNIPLQELLGWGSSTSLAYSGNPHCAKSSLGTKGRIGRPQGAQYFSWLLNKLFRKRAACKARLVIVSSHSNVRVSHWLLGAFIPLSRFPTSQEV